MFAHSRFCLWLSFATLLVFSPFAGIALILGRLQRLNTTKLDQSPYLPIRCSVAARLGTTGRTKPIHDRTVPRFVPLRSHFVRALVVAVLCWAVGGGLLAQACPIVLDIDAGTGRTTSPRETRATPRLKGPDSPDAPASRVGRAARSGSSGAGCPRQRVPSRRPTGRSWT